MNARDFGATDDPYQAAREDVEPFAGLTPAQRYARFLDLMSFLESIWKSVEPERRARYDRANEALDQPGRWWDRVPRA